MSDSHADALKTLLQRILELHQAGCSPQEIASRVFTTDPDTARFRMEMAVEIILNYASRPTKESDKGAVCDVHQARPLAG